MINVLKKLRGKYVLRKEKLSQFVILVYPKQGPHWIYGKWWEQRW